MKRNYKVQETFIDRQMLMVLRRIFRMNTSTPPVVETNNIEAAET